MSRVLLSANVAAAIAYLARQQPARDDLGLPAILQPLRPKGGGWMRCENLPPEFYEREGIARPYVLERWYNRGHEVLAFTAIESVTKEGTAVDRLEYHISVSGRRQIDADGNFGPPYRVSRSRAAWTLRCFGFEDGLEDNHVPGGLVRNFWRPLNEKEIGEVCKCVDAEPAIREMKGDYVWRGLKEP